MRTVSEVSRLTGVSIRTLHHYDAIGLLKPTQTTDRGYRLYDNEALIRLQTILLFRELQFPLKEIREILDRPDFDPMQAIGQQIGLMELQRRRLDQLISLARQIQETGVIELDFSAFDKDQINQYTAEAKARWGRTDAWQEYEQKAQAQTADETKAAGDALMDIFREIGRIRSLAPDSAEAQRLIDKLRAFITEHYYTCTPEILHGLGQMYAADNRMTENINSVGGAGTAEFARQAIEIYCANQ